MNLYLQTQKLFFPQQNLMRMEDDNIQNPHGTFVLKKWV